MPVMRRHLPLVIAFVVLAGAFLLPHGSPPRLAALQCHEFLHWKVGPAPSEGVTDERPPLWRMVLDGPAARDAGEGRWEVRLRGMLLGGEPAETDQMRRSLARGFRDLPSHGDFEALAKERGITEILVLGEDLPEAEGATFRLDAEDGSARIQYWEGEGRDPVADILQPWTPPGRGSIFPPLMAVALAVLFRRPLLALFAGILTGAFLMRRAAEAGLAASAGGGALDVFTKYFHDQLVDRDRLLTIGFVFFMLAMVGVMTRSGGIQGLMDAIARRARTVRRTQIATYLMGLAIFFDDYANTILVGSTMRPLTDRFKISREKLSYLVDSTAAPVAGLSVFSTWIAFEVSTFSAQLPAAGLAPADGYEIFFRTIPYSFYCILTLVFVGLVVFTGRDLGPMLDAERRARRTGKVLRPGGVPMVGEKATTMEPAPGIPHAAWRAVLPLLTFLFWTLGHIFVNGIAGVREAQPELPLFSVSGITEVLYAGSGYEPLFYGALAGFAVACIGGITAGLLLDVLRAAWTTVRSMGVAFAILYLAWMIGAVCSDLGTAPYLTSLVGNAIDPLLLPTLLFLLAGGVAFATGSSWSTMSILLPLVVGLAYHMGSSAVGLAPTGPESGQLLMVMSIAAVLSGAIFGDHCSPISDTTVMSSIASASDHIDHVRTQAPYSLLVMGVAAVFGYLPATYLGLSPWLCVALGSVALAGLLFLFGRRADDIEIAEA